MDYIVVTDSDALPKYSSNIFAIKLLPDKKQKDKGIKGLGREEENQGIMFVALIPC